MPRMWKNCLIDFKDYKIILNKCFNKHSIENILSEEFNDIQKYNELNILCNECNKNNNEIYNNKLFKCCNCNINICPLCKLKHNKDHILIDYELKNYLCNVHGKKYISYCKECNMNLCDLCELEHNKNHNYFTLNKVITNKENNMNELRLKIDSLKNEINDIINKLNKIIDNMEIYYNINNNIINNYNINNKNYELLMNINSIYNYNEKIIKDINEIINENSIEKKFTYLYNIYDKMMTTNEIIIKYKIGEDDDAIRIFGDKFVENNKGNFQMIINGKIYNLNFLYNINNEEENGILEIKLKQIKDASNISYMFSKCQSLIKLPDIYKWNTNKVTDMSFMFYQCSELLSLPDISRWNTNNLTSMENIFSECGKLSSLPDISKWNTKNINNMRAIFELCSSLTELPDYYHYLIFQNGIQIM